MEPGAENELMEIFQSDGLLVSSDIRLARIGDDALGLPSTLTVFGTGFNGAAWILEACSDI